MSDVRVDPLTGETVVVVGERQGRPNLPTDDCPFCPGGLEAPEPYDVRWFVNRWPPLPGERGEIVLYTPEHDASLGSLSVEQAERVIELWAERTVALGARNDVAYVLVFENRGPEVGATIPHPHGQIYAFDSVPPSPLRELENEDCALCSDDGADRVVCSGRGWRAWVPYAATWPYALLVAPEQHVADLPSAKPTWRGAAEVLVDALARLDRLFGAPMPYMFWWHQRPTDGGDWPMAHLHAHVAPLYRKPKTPRFVASGELGSGIFFNPVAPEEAAAALRAV